MNKDINKTLMALVPILKMNGENVTNIEAVHDWYKVGDREYMKEVAEITYDNGTVRYADIGCDSNLTAIYDVIAVIQQIKPRSKAIERIERGVYSLSPAQPERKKPVFKTGESVYHVSYADGTGGFEKNKWADWTCPDCGWFVGEQYIPRRHNQQKCNYCARCGCAIDWSDADMRGEEV